MQKRVWLLCSVLLLLLSGFRTTDEWTIYTSTMGHYAVSFPGAPLEIQSDDDDIHMLSYSTTDTTVFLLAWTDMSNYYPSGRKENIKKMLEESMDDAASSMKAKDVKTINIQLTGNPYIEFTFNSDNLLAKERIYIVNKFRYSLLAMGPPANGFTPDMNKFVTSFLYLP